MDANNYSQDSVKESGWGPKRKTCGIACGESQSSKQGRIMEHRSVEQSTGNLPSLQRDSNNGSFPGWKCAFLLVLDPLPS
jgi:hypothetical protein